MQGFLCGDLAWEYTGPQARWHEITDPRFDAYAPADSPLA